LIARLAQKEREGGGGELEDRDKCSGGGVGGLGWLWGRWFSSHLGLC